MISVRNKVRGHAPSHSQRDKVKHENYFSDEESDASSTTSASSYYSYDSESSYGSESGHSRETDDGELRESPIPMPTRQKQAHSKIDGNKLMRETPVDGAPPTPFNPVVSPMNSIGYNSDPRDVYKSLVVGRSALPPKPSNPAFLASYENQNESQRRSHHGITTDDLENESPNESLTTPTDVYQALVVGSGPPTHSNAQVFSSPSFQSVGSHNYAMGPRPPKQTMQQWNVAPSASFQSVGSTRQYSGSRQRQQLNMHLNSPSFQSVGSNYSRQVVYQSSHWDYESNMHTQYDNVEDREEDERVQNRAMFGAFAASPALGYANNASSKKRASMTKVNKQALATRPKPSALSRVACGASGVEGDLLGLMNSVRDHFTINEEEDGEGDEKGGEEDNGVSLTRISADLRKQRLRNRVLQNERDNVSQENFGLRDKVIRKETEIQELRNAIQALEKVEKKTVEEVVQRDVKIASLMNEFLELNGETTGLDRSTLFGFVIDSSWYRF